MLLLYLTGMVFILAFGLVVFVGPPFLPTLRDQTEAALDLLELKPGQTMLELGSGDGRVMLAAAKRGLNVVGVELNPLLVVYSKLRTWRYRKQVRVIWGDFFSVDWPPADGVFTFMLGRLMGKLDGRLSSWNHKPVRLASFAFAVPGKEPLKMRSGVYLYEYK